MPFRIQVIGTNTKEEIPSLFGPEPVRKALFGKSASEIFPDIRLYSYFSKTRNDICRKKVLTSSASQAYHMHMRYIDISAVLGHKEKTPLFRVCNREINGYIDPPKEGVAKGDKIGPSFMRNAAATLIALTNLQMKVISQRSGISYASMRTWNTQEDFKKAQDRIRREFIDFLKDAMNHGVKEKDQFDRYLYHREIRKKLEANVGSAKIEMPFASITATATVLNKDFILSEIERHESILTTGVVSQVERDDMRRMLSMVKAYIKRKG